jgi:hypothetical protein
VDAVVERPEIALVIATVEIGVIHEDKRLARLPLSEEFGQVIETVEDRERTGLLHQQAKP